MDGRKSLHRVNKFNRIGRSTIKQTSPHTHTQNTPTTLNHMKTSCIETATKSTVKPHRTSVRKYDDVYVHAREHTIKYTSEWKWTHCVCSTCTVRHMVESKVYTTSSPIIESAYTCCPHVAVVVVVNGDPCNDTRIQCRDLNRNRPNGRASELISCTDTPSAHTNKHTHRLTHNIGCAQ